MPVSKPVPPAVQEQSPSFERCERLFSDPQGRRVQRQPQVPDYELIRSIGAGAYGEVWLARNAFGEYRAAKIIWRSEFGGEERSFQREFEGIRRFEPISRSHPSQLAILHVGRSEFGFYYVMELADPAPDRRQSDPRVLPGFDVPAQSTHRSSAAASSDQSIDPEGYSPHTLRHDLKVRGRLPADDVVQLGLSLSRALVHLHAQGLVHRDIKPSNIVFVHGKAKLADIGLVTHVGDERSMVGTEGYLAPEGPGKPQADIYSLGKVLYEAAMGRNRRDFPDLPDDWQKLPDLDRLLELNEILLKACATDLRERYASAGELAGELEFVGNGHSVIRNHRWAHRRKLAMRLTRPAAVLVLAGTAFLFAARHGHKEPALSLDPEAVKLYQTALHKAEGSTLETTLRAYEDLRHAWELDPRFVDAYYRFFELNWSGWADHLPPHNNMRANMKWCRDRIAAVSTNCPQYHMVSASIKFLDWHFEDAIAEVEMSLEKDPKFRSHGLYGWMLLRARGDVQAARREWRRVEDVTPDLITLTQLGTTDYLEGDYSRAIEQFNRAVSYEDRSSLAHDLLGRAYEANGQYDLGLREFATAEKLAGGNDREVETRYSRYRAALASGGPRTMWQLMLKEALGEPSPDAYRVAKLHARLGNRDEMLRWLETARKEHDDNMFQLLIDDWWDPFRHDAEFNAILKKVGLPENAQPRRKVSSVPQLR
jgi:serine/threonine protein kinase